MLGQPCLLLRGDVDVDLFGDCLGKFGLQGQDVGPGPLIAFRPDVAIGGAAINCALIRTRLPTRVTVPSTT